MVSWVFTPKDLEHHPQLLLLKQKHDRNHDHQKTTKKPTNSYPNQPQTNFNQKNLSIFLYLTRIPDQAWSFFISKNSV